MARVLVVDDDRYVTKYLSAFLAGHGYTVRVASQARRAASVAGDFKPDAAVVDLAMPGKDGLGLIPDLKAACPRCQVIIYTGAGDVEKAVEAMKRGAYDFIQKPLNHDALLLSLRRALEVRHLRDENAFLRQAYKSHFQPGLILAFSESMRAALALAGRYRAIPDVPVLIEGESGTGKELLARYIHHDERDYARPFVAINCGAIPHTLVESELFGYAPGAFTGARVEGAQGKLQAAEGGTLFLDEIGELDTASQVKLLRFLEQGTFFPVGATKELTVRTRVVSATNRDLAAAVASGEFRRDLYYRVNVGHLRIPPLRERREDILPMARHFLREFGLRFNNPFDDVDPAAARLLLNAPWEGNVREVRNAMERVALMHKGPVLLSQHLAFLPGAPQVPAYFGPPAEAPLPEGELDVEGTMLRLIQRALDRHHGNQSRAARYLRLTREALRYRLNKLAQRPRRHSKGTAR